MNKKILLVSLASFMILLCGCTDQKKLSDIDSSSDKKNSIISSVKSENAAVSKSRKKDKSKNLKLYFTHEIYGNTAEQYAHEALTCRSPDGVYFLTPEMNLVKRSNNGSIKNYNISVRGGINYFNRTLYYISADNGYVYSIKKNKYPKRCRQITDRVLSLIVSEKGFIYSDEDSRIHIKENGKKECVICNDMALWISCYGKWIIYVKLNGTQNKGIYAYNLEKRKSEKLCDYGMYPVISGHSMYFQSKKGGISVYDLSSGNKKKLTSRWGQNMIINGQIMFFTNAHEIYTINMNSGKIRMIYYVNRRKKKNTIIDRMWMQEKKIVFTERRPDDSVVWKTINKDGDVFTYEDSFKYSLEN